MPRKTPGRQVGDRQRHQSFNEAAARCRGKPRKKVVDAARGSELQ